MCEAGWRSFSSCPGKEKKYYGGKINKRTGVAKINSQGEKYDMKWGTSGEGNY
jgi:hypothetical protein